MTAIREIPKRELLDSVITKSQIASGSTKDDHIIEWATKTTLTFKGSYVIPIKIGGSWFFTDTDVIISTVTNMDTGTISNGKDYYIYACISTNSIVFKISLNTTMPSGFTTNTSRKLGGFHTLCADVGTISEHTLTDYLANEILPRSVWDLKYRPFSEPEGMVFAKSGKWVDIYLPSVSNNELVSIFNGTIADGVSTEKFHTYKFEQWFVRIGKKTISQLEFVDASIGSNQSTNIAGSADPVTTGGHSDTAGRRMISDIGCEDMCGAMWQWGRDTGAHVGTSIWKDAFDGNDTGVGGQTIDEPYRAVLGGSWTNGVWCGSRCAAWIISPLTLDSDRSSRGIAEPKN